MQFSFDNIDYFVLWGFSQASCEWVQCQRESHAIIIALPLAHRMFGFKILDSIL